MNTLRKTRHGHLWQLRLIRTMPARPLISKHTQRRSHNRLSRAAEESDFKVSDKQYDSARITRLGMFINLSMAVSKGAVGIVAQSNALVADAAHSLSDLLSDLVTLWSMRIARLPPDVHHPYGYGKYEAVGSLTVGALLISCGAGIGYESLMALQDILWASHEAAVRSPIWSITGFDRNAQLGLAASVAVVSIALKEALYQATIKVAQEAKSKVLIANAWHHRTDALSSVVALGGIAGTIAGLPYLDPIGGILVAAMIGKMGANICLESLRELTDKSVEKDVLHLVRELSRGVDDVLHVSNIRARQMGPYTLVDLRVHLHARASVSMAQQITERLKAQVMTELPNVSEVLVYIDVKYDDKDVSCLGTTLFSSTSMPPYRRIKLDVRQALHNIPHLLGTSHISAHCTARNSTGRSIVVDVTIAVDDSLTIEGARSVARTAQRWVSIHICKARLMCNSDE